MRLGAWIVILVAFIGLFYFHRWTEQRHPRPTAPAELLVLKDSVLNRCSPRVHFDDQVMNIPADINDYLKNMGTDYSDSPADYVKKSRGVSRDTDFAPAQFGADNSELQNYFEKLRTDPDVYSFTPVPTLADQTNPKNFQTELLANINDLNPVPFYDGIVAYEDFQGSQFQSL